jgi:hypothetical protein
MTKVIEINALAKAFKTIGLGLIDLSDALVAPGASVEEPEEPRPGSRRPRSTAPVEEPKEEVEETEEEEVKEEPSEEEEIKLAELQNLAKDLIKAGGRSKLRKILEKHELETVSSAPMKLWKTLKKELEAVS